MGIYSQYIFPLILDRVMSQKEMTEIRKELLEQASGKVLEIGFGTGKNIPYYPAQINHLTAIDANPGMQRYLNERLSQARFPVDFNVHNGETLPMPSNHFDTVVTTWVLCSIVHVKEALSEVYRVLKPGGKFLFVEHGLSNETRVQRWQRRLTPIQKKIGDGCHLDRDIPAIIRSQAFQRVDIEEFYLPKTVKIGAYTYKGIAVK